MVQFRTIPIDDEAPAAGAGVWLARAIAVDDETGRDGGIYLGTLPRSP
jgi:hypothetical protein